MTRQYDNRIRDHVKETVTMERVLDLLGMEPPNRQHKISSIYVEERTPSLHIYKDSYHCYATGRGGDVIQFVMDVRQVSYGEALRFLGGQAPVSGRKRPLPSRRRDDVDLTGKFGRERNGTQDARLQAAALIARKWPTLTVDDLDQFGIKVTATSLWAPHFDDTGRVRGVKIRSLSDGSKRAVPGSTFTSRLYRVVDRPGAKVAVVCEGESDTWCLTKWATRSPYSHLVQVYGLPSGAGTWRDEWAATLAGFDGVVAVFDDDTAGRQALDRIQGAVGELDDVWFGSVWPPGGRVAEALADDDEWIDQALDHACQ